MHVQGTWVYAKIDRLVDVGLLKLVNDAESDLAAGQSLKEQNVFQC